jgi:hypothetical protein
VGGYSARSRGRPAVSTASTVALRDLRERFASLAREFAGAPLRAVCILQPTDERSPDELDEDDFKLHAPVTIALAEPINPVARRWLEHLAVEADRLLGEVSGIPHPEESTPAGRWLLRVANMVPWAHPEQHGPWCMSKQWAGEEETYTEITDVFVASAAAIDAILFERGDRNPSTAPSVPALLMTKEAREADLVDRAVVAVLRDPSITKTLLAQRLGVAPYALSRGELGKAVDRALEAARRQPQISDSHADHRRLTRADE